MSKLFISPEELHAQGTTYPQAYSMGKFYRNQIAKFARKDPDHELVPYFKEYLASWKEWMRQCFPDRFKG